MNTDRIERTIVLDATLDRVWKALSDSTEFGTWFGVRFDGPFIAGANLRGAITPTKVNAQVAEAQRPYEGKPFEITVERMEPQRLLSFRWHPFAMDPAVDYSKEPTTLIEFTLEPVAGGVRLTVVESGFDQIPLERRAAAFKANDQGWALQCKLIEAYLNS